MNSLTKQIYDEKGIVVIIALFLLSILTIISISVFIESYLELQIASNEKSYNIACYNAESGIYVAGELISKTIDNAAIPTGSELGAVNYTNRPQGDTTDYYRQVMGYDSYDNGVMDISFNISESIVDVDIQRVSQEITEGGSAEFANSYETGNVSSDGVSIIYNINSFGTGPSGTSNITGLYRKVVN